MIAKPGYTVAFVREPKIKQFETQPGPVSMRITIEGGDMVQAKVVEVKCETGWADMDDCYKYKLSDGTWIMADACLVTGYGDDTAILLAALKRQSEFLKQPVCTSMDLHLAARADQLFGALSYDFANQERLAKLPIPHAIEQP